MGVDENEVGVSVIKSLLGNVPFVGTVLDEMLFEYRGRLKQKRIETFIENFAAAVGKLNKEEIDIDEIKSDDFSDFFESLLLHVAKTGSESKAERFKRLLLKQITNPVGLDAAEVQLEIIATLQDYHIMILEGMCRARGKGYVEAYGAWVVAEIEMNRLEAQIDATGWAEDESNSVEVGIKRRISDLKKEFQKNEKKWRDLYAPFDPATYGPECDYHYYVQALCSKGLLVDRGSEFPGVFPFYCTEITQLGMDIIERLSSVE